MGVFFDYRLIGYNNEINFIKDLITYLTGLDPRITCSNSPDDEFDSSKWEEGTSHIPSFTFSINNDVSFTIKRWYNNTYAPLSGPSHDYACIYNDTILAVDGFLPSWQPANIVDIATREFRISNIITDTFILISFAGCMSSGGSHATENINIVYIIDSTKTYLSCDGTLAWNKNTIFNASSKTFTDSSTGTSGILLSRFSYVCPPGYIDYIKNAVYSNNGSKLSSIMTLYDCTTVTIGDTVSLEDGIYIAVGPHQLVKI